MRIELTYLVLQTSAYPLGQTTMHPDFSPRIHAAALWSGTNSLGCGSEEIRTLSLVLAKHLRYRCATPPQSQFIRLTVSALTREWA